MKRRMLQLEFAEPIAGSVNVVVNNRKKHLNPRLFRVFDDLCAPVRAVAVCTRPAVPSISALFAVKPLSPEVEAKHECSVKDQIQNPALGSSFLVRMPDFGAGMLVSSPAFGRVVRMIGHARPLRLSKPEA
jgi:hypothetical protein